MTPRADARAHLAKAKEFLTAAELAAETELYSAAASNAVTSGINSKDAICLALTGVTKKADDHTDAVVELRRAGSESKTSGATTAKLANTLARLLSLKSKSQYQAAPVAEASARRAVDWAQALLDGAQEIVGSS
jgi:uncharacterized protein (UPF0332 family)